MRSYTLTVIGTRHAKSPLRTEAVDCDLAHPLTVGSPMVLHADPVDPATTVRIITTTNVESVYGTPDDCVVTTGNTIYRLRKNT